MLYWIAWFIDISPKSTLKEAPAPLMWYIWPQHKLSRDRVCWFKLFSVTYSLRVSVLLRFKVLRGVVFTCFTFLTLYLWHTGSISFNNILSCRVNPVGQRAVLRMTGWFVCLQVELGSTHYWAFQVAEVRKTELFCCCNARPSSEDTKIPALYWNLPFVNEDYYQSTRHYKTILYIWIMVLCWGKRNAP